jgi:glycerophosphoryl diester phosphodiesterase
MQLLRGGGPLLRIGHRGAAALAPPNTIAAIEAALDAGVDMVELDVIAAPDGRLLLGHSLTELAADPVPLDSALELVATRPGLTLLADVKRPGYEVEIVAALRRRELIGRTLASSADLRTLRALRRIEPALARGRTYPRDRLGLGKRRAFAPVAGAGLAAMRAALPRQLGRILGGVAASVLTLEYRFVSRALVERCHQHGVAVFAWTVNDPDLVAAFDGLAVDGVITDDPRVFPVSRATLQA